MLYNGVIRSATVVVLDMVAVTHIMKPQRASIFGEYTYMQLRLSALWIGYGIGKTCKDIPIYHISQIKCLDLNIVKCCPSSMLSPGCDVVSSMLGIGKQTAWHAWNAYPNNPRSELSHTRLAAYATS